MSNAREKLRRFLGTLALGITKTDPDDLIFHLKFEGRNISPDTWTFEGGVYEIDEEAETITLIDHANKRLSPDNMREAVQRGITLLNSVRPGWQSAVKWDRVNMASPYYSVVAQLWGSEGMGYYSIEDKLAEELGVSNSDVRINEPHFGFSLVGSYNPNYQQLTNLWKELAQPTVEPSVETPSCR